MSDLHIEEQGYTVLNKFIKHNNIPYKNVLLDGEDPRVVSVDRYPKQDEAKLGTLHQLKFKDERYCDESCGDFVCVRFDLEEPHVVIMIELKQRVVLVMKPEEVPEDGKTLNEVPLLYPVQYDEFLGLKTYDYYTGFPDNPMYGYVLRLDACSGTPYGVLLEYDADSMRFVLLDETRCLTKTGLVPKKQAMDYLYKYIKDMIDNAT